MIHIDASRRGNFRAVSNEWLDWGEMEERLFWTFFLPHAVDSIPLHVIVDEFNEKNLFSKVRPDIKKICVQKI